jgi:hypothetical protein
VLEPERREEQGLHHALVRLTGDDLDDTTREVEAGVVVRPHSSDRRELREPLQVVDHPREGVVPGPVIGEVVPDPPRRVGQEVTHGDRSRHGPVGQRQLPEIPAHRRVELELSPLDQGHRDGPRERLGDRPDLEQRVGRDVERVVDGRHAVRSDVLLAVVEEPDGDAGRVGLGDSGFDRRADVVEQPHGATLSLLRFAPP